MKSSWYCWFKFDKTVAFILIRCFHRGSKCLNLSELRFFQNPSNLVNVRHLHWYPFLIKTHIMSFVTFSVFAKTSPLNKKSLIIGCLRQVSKKTLIQAKKSCFLTTLHNLHFQHQIWVLNRTSIIQILSEEYSKLCNCYILKRDNMMIPHRNWNCHVSDTI